MEFTQDDIKDLADCAWYEARGEPDGGMELVMWCVRNRIGAIGFPKTLHAVVYQKGAFSWTDPTNPEHALKPAPEDPQYALALQLAPQVLAADESESKCPARYYANLETMDKGGWFERYISGPDGNGMPDHPLVLKFGKHWFYK